MRKLTTITAASSVAVGGLFLAGALLPAAATTDSETPTEEGTTESDSFLTDRLTRLKEALSGLVEDGTLTQDEADTVADTLAGSDALGHGYRGHGPRGHGDGLSFDAAAEVLGLTADEVHEALRDGTSLADVAEQQGVDVTILVDALVTAATERIDAAVTAGDLDQDRADELEADLAERIGEAVDEVPSLHHHRGGPADVPGAGDLDGGSADGEAASATPAGAVERVLQAV